MGLRYAPPTESSPPHKRVRFANQTAVPEEDDLSATQNPTKRTTRKNTPSLTKNRQPSAVPRGILKTPKFKKIFRLVRRGGALKLVPLDSKILTKDPIKVTSIIPAFEQLAIRPPHFKTPITSSAPATPRPLTKDEIAAFIKMATYPAYVHNDLYKIMDKMHRVLTRFNLEYWAEGGTAIGVMRHKGIMPWDDDLDIEMPKAHHARLTDPDVKAALDQEGLVLNANPNLFKVMLKDPSGPQTAFIDVFDVEDRDIEDKSGNKYRASTYCQDWAFKAWGQNHYFLPNEKERFDELPFGPIKVRVANGTYTHLDRGYPGWNKEFFIGGGHLSRSDPLAQRAVGLSLPALPEYCTPAPWDPNDFPNAPVKPLSA